MIRPSAFESVSKSSAEHRSSIDACIDESSIVSYELPKSKCVGTHVNVTMVVRRLCRNVSFDVVVEISLVLYRCRPRVKRHQ